MKQAAIRSFVGALLGLFIAFGLAHERWLAFTLDLTDLVLPVIFASLGGASVPTQAGVKRLMRGSSSLLLLLVLLPSCAALSGGGWKPYAHLGNQAAQAICAEVYAEQRRISLEEAGQKFCATLEQLQPFLDLATRAKERAVERGLR